MRDEYSQQIKPAPEDMMIKFHIGYEYVDTWDGMEQDMIDIAENCKAACGLCEYTLLILLLFYYF